MEEVILNFRQHGFINFGSMTSLVGGLALTGLLAYGPTTGHELPLCPALPASSEYLPSIENVLFGYLSA
ncbi:MAG: hypothetical protein V5B44_12220 [Candidatus Accumulibacter necessarius]|jgi:hypothetical protein|uniref:hypothetical protein n=1 Tax=Candidatus Accumulibacter necessarius TaxID=2954386 RepID=UPI002FC2C8A9